MFVSHVGIAPPRRVLTVKIISPRVYIRKLSPSLRTETRGEYKRVCDLRKDSQTRLCVYINNNNNSRSFVHAVLRPPAGHVSIRAGAYYTRTLLLYTAMSSPTAKPRPATRAGLIIIKYLINCGSIFEFSQKFTINYIYVCIGR